MSPTIPNNVLWWKCCPWCLTNYPHLGEPVETVWQDEDLVLQAKEDVSAGISFKAFSSKGLCPNNPFWHGLPHSDIFSCFTSDLLHKLYKGVFKDHIVNWATKCVCGGQTEIDQHFCAMKHGTDLHHFKKGISLITQWTGIKYKNMEKVFLGVLTSQAEPGLIFVVHTTLDFIYYVHFGYHTTDSLITVNLNRLGLHFTRTNNILLTMASEPTLTFQNSIWCNITLLLLFLLDLLMATVLRALSAFIPTSQNLFIVPPTRKTTSNKWWSGSHIKKHAIALPTICIGQSQVTLSDRHPSLAQHLKFFQVPNFLFSNVLPYKYPQHPKSQSTSPRM